MPFLTSTEAFNVSDSFLQSLYGHEIFDRWVRLKSEMQFITEREYVMWLMDVAEHYKSDEDVAEHNKSSEDVAEQYDSYGDVAEKDKIGKYEPIRDDYTTNVDDYEYHDEYRDNQSLQANIGNVKVESVDSSFINPPSVYQPPVQYYKNIPQNARSFSGTHLTKRTNYFVNPTSELGDVRETLSMDTYVDDGNNDQIEMGDEQSSRQIAVDEILVSDSDGDDAAGNNKFQLQDMVHESNVTVSRITSGKSARGEKFVCPHCLFQSKVKADLKRHVLAVHERRRPFPCNYCNHKASRNHHLKIHMITKHGAKSKYQCAKCLRYFAEERCLRKHVATFSCQ